MHAYPHHDLAPRSPLARLRLELWRLVENVRGGMHLAFLVRVPPQHFYASPDQIALLVLLNFAVGFAWEWLLTEPPRSFDATGLAVQGAWLVATFALAYLAVRPGYRNRSFEQMLVMLLAPLFTGWVGFAALELAVNHWPAFAERVDGLYWGYVFAAWLFPVYTRAIYVATGMHWPHAVRLASWYASAVAVGFWAWPSTYLVFTGYDESAAAVAEASDADRLDAEQVLHVQRSRVQALLSELAPQRPGVVDLYFVGFAASAEQAVFRREIEYVRELFDRRFDTAGRSIALINHEETLDAAPLASRSNLRDTLAGLAQVMDPEEDVLFLYLTGHGSKKHVLQVEFPGLPLGNLGRDRLARLLDESGIAWRVVGVSACYSGGFVASLQDERTLVLTAAAADRTSFGCSDRAERTWFADAYFAHGLEQERDFVAAFEIAREQIAARETEEGVTPSQPQIALGAAMEEKLAVLAARLEADANSGAVAKR